MAKKLFTVVGARPQFIKAAALSRALRASTRLEEAIIHTGQHYDSNMSDIFFEELSIPTPKRHLGIGGGPHGQMSGRLLEALEAAMLEDRPDIVMVYGDTNSTLAGALAAAKLQIPVAHVEAGLRSFNRRMPEEINRVVADHLSALLLCPTTEAVKNLLAEGITRNVQMVGDVMHDATLFAREEAKARSTILQTLDLRPGGFALCTLHRAENTDDAVRFQRVIDFLETEAQRTPIVFPVHPRTRKLLAERTLRGIRLIDPVGYFDMHALLAASAVVFTDSGGLQKEAYFHRTPCVTLRDETEWVETIEAGWNRLWTAPDYRSPRREISDYGAGDAAQKTVAALEQL